MKQKKFFVGAAAALLLTLILSAGPAEAKKCPRHVKVEAAEVKGDAFSEYACFRGEIHPLTVELNAAADAKVKAIFFQTDAEVKAGDTLLTLDAAALDKEIQDAEAAVEQWQKTLKARRNWKEKSERAEKQAEENLGQATAKLALLQKKAARYVVKTPISGRIERLNAAPDVNVTGGAVLAVVVDPGVMKFAVSGEEAASLRDKEKVFVRFESLASGRNGEVAVGEPGRAEIILDNADGQLTAGLQATLKMLKKESSDVVVLNQEQVLQDSLGAHVYVVENKHARRAPLTLGAVEEDRVLVLSGLDKGMILIVKGVECLQDGKKITVVNKLAEKAEVKAEEKPARVEIVEKKEERVMPEEVVLPGERRLKVGVNLIYQYVTAEGFSGFYGRAVGAGGEIDYRLNDKMEIWIGGAYSSKAKDLDWAEGAESKYTMLPLALGVNYYVLRKEKVSAFVGGRVNFVLFKDTTPYDEVKENLFGGGIFGGGSYQLGERFSARATLGFNLVKKNVAMTVEPDYPLDLSNVELKLGVFYGF